jgi:rhodanese-related sulfurtransferase
METCRHAARILVLVIAMASGVAMGVAADSAKSGSGGSDEEASTRLGVYSLELRKAFPDVPVISPSELAASPRRLLLDAREAQEYEVSRIPAAILLEDDPVTQLNDLGVAKHQPIVVYCSVGYRSAKMVRVLKSAGFTDVRNLEGSIFAWANEGRPLINGEGPTTWVHPYDEAWGRFLDRSRWRNPNENAERMD